MGSPPLPPSLFAPLPPSFLARSPLDSVVTCIGVCMGVPSYRRAPGRGALPACAQMLSTAAAAPRIPPYPRSRRGCFGHGAAALVTARLLWSRRVCAQMLSTNPAAPPMSRILCVPSSLVRTPDPHPPGIGHGCPYPSPWSRLSVSFRGPAACWSYGAREAIEMVTARHLQL